MLLTAKKYSWHDQIRITEYTGRNLSQSDHKRLPVVDMKESQRQILGILQESDLWLTPGNIAYNIEYVGDYVRQECRSLWEHELLRREADQTRPFYRITERGTVALRDDTLDIEFSYSGSGESDDWTVIVEPTGKPLREYGEEYHDARAISWGEQGSDHGAFNLASDILRHAINDEVASSLAFPYYEEVTRHLSDDFELTESEIEHWVANHMDVDEEIISGSR